MRRRALLAAAASAATAAAVAPRPAPAAAGFPDRPIRLIVPFAAGGNADIVARLVAPAMAERLGQPVVVDNRPGAGGSVGAAAAARSRPDGYTMLLGSTGPLSVNPVVQANLPYDAERDFAPVGLISRTPLAVTVRAGLPPRTLGELIAYSKANPGRATVASSGTASASHLAIELFNAATGAGLVHVPYRSGGDLTPDLVAGNVAAAMFEISTAMPLHREGRARVLAVASARRSPTAPDIPTVIEAGVPDFTAVSYVAIVLPSGVPADVVEALRAALAGAVGDPVVRRRLEEMGTEAATGEDVTPAGLAAFLRGEAERARRGAAIAGLRPG
jgi:tripartite-type tricarboxylate transporter receptor subunit TctC